MVQISAQSLGQQTVTVGGRAVHWPTRAARDLFYLLLIHPHGRTRTDLSDLLWGAAGAAEGGTNFKVTQHRVRQALGDPDATQERGGRYVLAPAYYAGADHHRFQALLQAVRTAEHREDRLRQTYQALSLYQGDFLPDHPGAWAEETRNTLRAAYVRARLDVAGLHCSAAECQLAVRSLAGGLAADPLAGEQYHQNLMSCLSTLGRVHEAVSHYRHFLTFIQRDIGDTPMAETLRLAGQIKNAEPHPARHIGQPLPCPRRVLYGAGAGEVAAPAPPDLPHWQAEVRRGQQMLGLLRKLTAARHWASLQQAVEQALTAALHTPYVWLGRSLLPGTVPELPGWPADVLAALQLALGREELPAAPETAGFPVASSAAGRWATVWPVRDAAGHPLAWLGVAHAADARPPSSGDLELLVRVVDALRYVLSQPRWRPAPPGPSRTRA